MQLIKIFSIEVNKKTSERTIFTGAQILILGRLDISIDQNYKITGDRKELINLPGEIKE